MHSVTCACLCWFKDNSCLLYLFFHKQMHIFLYPCRPVLAAALWWMDGCKNMSLVSNCYKCRPIKYIYLYHCLRPVCCLISLFGFSPFFPCVGFDPVTPLIIPLLKKKRENLSADEASVQISLCCLLEIAVDMLSLHKQTLAIEDEPTNGPVSA